MTACAVLLPIREVSDKPPERVQQQRATARAALAQCAAMCGAPADGWLQNADGAPMPNSGFFWSLSHKRNWAGAVIARSPVGIDIEHVAPRGTDLYDKVGTTAEWALLGGRTWENFFRLWTAKEATLKANSRGIGYLADCTLITLDPDAASLTVAFAGAEWLVRQFAWAGHIAAVATTEVVQWRLPPENARS